MEFQFDIASFIFGGVAAILGLEVARLAGSVAGRIHARLAYRKSTLEQPGFISTNSFQQRSGS